MGICDTLKKYRWAADVVTMIANKADLEGWKLFLDICTHGCACATGGSCSSNPCGRRCITMPREVQTVIAVNIGGRPALGLNSLFSFHLNGPGDGCQSCSFSWTDAGAWHSTYRDLLVPAQLVTHLQGPEDNGRMFIIYGYDKDGNKLRREECNTFIDGWRLPTIYGVAVPDSTAPFVARITGIYKDETAGTIRLATTDSTGQSGVNLGVYEPDERTPQLRRIVLNRACDWVRVAVIKSNPSFHSQFDHVPLQSRMGFLLGMQARKAYAALQLAEAMQFEAQAARLEQEAQNKLEAPLYAPIQVLDRAASLRDRSDYDIV